MNTKLKTLIQALVDEVNEVKGEKDGAQRPENWWKMVDWHEPAMKTVYDSLSDETRKLISDAGLCPDCPDKKKVEFPVPPKADETTENLAVPCTELMAKEHPDWTPEKIKEQCEAEDKKKVPPKEEAKKEAELTPEEKKKKEEEEAAKLEEEKKKFPPKKDAKPSDPRAAIERANRIMKK